MGKITMNKTIVLRNEPFGGVYFNQLNGRIVIVDGEGFATMIKYLHGKSLTDRQKKFLNFFFNETTPRSVELRFSPSIKLKTSSFIITSTPILINLSLNNYCNLNCPFCYVPTKQIDNGQSLSVENFDMLLSDMIKSRVMQVAIGGGEPTLHPDFVDFLKKLRVKGNIVPNYTTNGTNLTEDVLYASKKYCGAVGVSYSEERESETLAAIKKLLNRKIQAHLHMILTKSRLYKLAKTIEKYVMLGVSNVVLMLFKPMGRGSTLLHEILNRDDFKTIFTEMLKLLSFRKKYGLKLYIDACSTFIFKEFSFLPESINGCSGALHSAFIDWNLEMKPCSFMIHTKGINLKESNISNAWNSPIFENFRHTIIYPRYQGCKTCNFFPNCWGGCPITPEIVFCEKKGKKI